MFKHSRNIRRFVGATLLALAVQFGGSSPSSAQEAKLTTASWIFFDARDAFEAASREKCYTMDVRRAAKILVQQYDKAQKLIETYQEVTSPTDGGLQLSAERVAYFQGQLKALEYDREMIAKWIVEVSRIPPCVPFDKSVLLVDPPSRWVLTPPSAPLKDGGRKSDEERAPTRMILLGGGKANLSDAGRDGAVRLPTRDGPGRMELGRGLTGGMGRFLLRGF